MDGLNPRKQAKFDGTNYKTWAWKMKFLLISLEVYYVLDPNLSPIPPQDPAAAVDEKAIAELEKQRVLRKEHEAICFKHIKDSLSERLCDLYALRSNNDPRLLWEALEANFKVPTDHVKINHLLKDFLDFRFVEDGRGMMDQAKELREIIFKLKDNSVTIPDALHKVAILTKLPRSWKTFTQRMLNLDVSPCVLLKEIRDFERKKNSITKTTTTPGQTNQLGVKKQPKNNFKKTVPRRNNVSSTDALNAVDDAEIDDLVALVNLNKM